MFDFFHMYWAGGLPDYSSLQNMWAWSRHLGTEVCFSAVPDDKRAVFREKFKGKTQFLPILWCNQSSYDAITKQFNIIEFHKAEAIIPHNWLGAYKDFRRLTQFLPLKDKVFCLNAHYQHNGSISEATRLNFVIVNAEAYLQKHPQRSGALDLFLRYYRIMNQHHFFAFAKDYFVALMLHYCTGLFFDIDLEPTNQPFMFTIKTLKPDFEKMQKKFNLDKEQMIMSLFKYKEYYHYPKEAGSHSHQDVQFYCKLYQGDYGCSHNIVPFATTTDFAQSIQNYSQYMCEFKTQTCTLYVIIKSAQDAVRKTLVDQLADVQQLEYLQENFIGDPYSMHIEYYEIYFDQFILRGNLEPFYKKSEALFDKELRRLMKLLRQFSMDKFLGNTSCQLNISAEYAAIYHKHCYPRFQQISERFLSSCQASGFYLLTEQEHPVRMIEQRCKASQLIPYSIQSDSKYQACEFYDTILFFNRKQFYNIRYADQRRLTLIFTSSLNPLLDVAISFVDYDLASQCNKFEVNIYLDKQLQQSITQCEHLKMIVSSRKPKLYLNYTKVANNLKVVDLFTGRLTFNINSADKLKFNKLYAELIKGYNKKNALRRNARICF